MVLPYDDDDPVVLRRELSQLRAERDQLKAILEKVCIDLELQGYTDWPSDVRAAMNASPPPPSV